MACVLSPGLDDLQNLLGISLAKDTSRVKFSLISDSFSRDVNEGSENSAFRNVEEFFKEVVDPDTEANDLQNLISSFPD